MYKLIASALFAGLSLSVTEASAEDRRFVLENQSNRTIMQVQSSNIGDTYFHDVDLLADEVLRPGESMVLEPDNHNGWCRFDVRVTFRNGDREDINDVNICEITRLVLYGDYYRLSY